uniref:GMP reductase n=1 Tax=Naja naja TaxID=35670 RepID=A0A8C6X9F5_NAJNA
MPHIDNDIKLDFKDVLLRPKRSTLKSRSETMNMSITPSFSYFPESNNPVRWAGLRDRDQPRVTQLAFVPKFSLFTAIHKHCALQEWKEFAAQNPDCLQVCFSPSFKEEIGQTWLPAPAPPTWSTWSKSWRLDLRKRFPDHTIMAGNVVTGEMVEELILSGADIIKVGIGPGSVCTTRKKTGVGYPQLSAVMECADAAHGLGGHIISDGGCHCPGDVAKAFGAGADFVMVGGMLAGHTESGGDLIEKEGKKYKLFYGMSSEVSMKKYAGGVAEYRASEGKVVEVPFKGDVEHTLRDILGGIRSTCTYVGAAKLKELSRRTTFIRVTQQVNPIFGAEDQP